MTAHDQLVPRASIPFPRGLTRSESALEWYAHDPYELAQTSAIVAESATYVVASTPDRMMLTSLPTPGAVRHDGDGDGDPIPLLAWRIDSDVMLTLWLDLAGAADSAGEDDLVTMRTERFVRFEP